MIRDCWTFAPIIDTDEVIHEWSITRLGAHTAQRRVYSDIASADIASPRRGRHQVPSWLTGNENALRTMQKAWF